MILEAPIMELNDDIVIDEILSKEMNVPVLSNPGSTDPRDIIGFCKEVFVKDGKLWARMELFKFIISAGHTKTDINELVFMRDISIKPQGDMNIKRIYKD